MTCNYKPERSVSLGAVWEQLLLKNTCSENDDSSPMKQIMKRLLCLVAWHFCSIESLRVASRQKHLFRYVIIPIKIVLSYTCYFDLLDICSIMPEMLVFLVRNTCSQMTKQIFFICYYDFHQKLLKFVWERFNVKNICSQNHNID